MKKVYIGFPIHNHPTAHFMGSFLCLASETPREMFEYSYDISINVSNLPVERSLLAHRALQLDCDLLLFIDDDIQFESKTVMSIMTTALEENAVVSVPYRVKQEGGRHVGYPLEQCGRAAEKKGSLIGAGSVGMGMTAIPTRIMKDIIKLAREGEHELPFFRAKRFPGEEIAGFFEFRVAKDLAGEMRFLQEDECFCKHVIDTGYKIWLETAFRVGHVGQYVYR